VERSSGAGPSQVRALPIRKSDGKNVRAATRANVSKEAFLYTDHALTYRTLDKDYDSEQVNHIIGEYVRGDVHTNSIEGFWSLFKRGVIGQYHSISVKHLRRYLDESAFRFNNRAAADVFGMVVRRMAKAIA
jgi:transposase-like protein